MPRKPVTISLPSDLVKETARFCDQQSVTLSEIAREALRDYLYRQNMEKARRIFTLKAQQQGLFSEKALLKRLEG